ncbi:MAG: isocitrate lyase/PEP mutase family protein [Lachnospiraceae bacterium]|nr:isocitrate lyase/PEP mutase family protein [Lachnospiraceae bacterium]
MNNEKMAKELRKMLTDGKVHYTVGVGDALGAKIACQVDGIDAILTSGYSFAAAEFAMPDAEYYTRDENCTFVKKCCDVSTKPIIADIDTGYGNAVTVIHTVHEFEKAGAAGMIIEDQISPKRCPICVDTKNKLISLEEAVGKIRAACENRLNPDTVIIARTDAPTWEEAIERGRAMKEAGADAIQLLSGAYQTPKGAHDLAAEIGLPLSVQIVGRMEGFTKDDMENVIQATFTQLPVAPVHAAIQAMWNVMKYWAENHTVVGCEVPTITHTACKDLLGMPEVEKLMDRYLPQESDLK